MNRHGPSTLALAAALLVVFAGMVVLLPADGAATLGVSEDPSAAGAIASLAPATDPTAAVDQHGLYEELSTAVSTGSGPSVSRQVDDEADPESEEGPDSEQRLHRWHCPICDATKLSFGSDAVDPSEAAANNLRSHIMNSDGGGHGPLGTVPGWITPRDLVDSVVVLALSG